LKESITLIKKKTIMTTIILFAILVLAAVQTYAIYTFKNIKSSTKAPCKRKKNEDATVTCKTDAVEISLVENTPVAIASDMPVAIAEENAEENELQRRKDVVELAEKIWLKNGWYYDAFTDAETFIELKTKYLKEGKLC